MKKIVLIIMFVFTVFLFAENNLQSQFKQANQNYQKNNYSQALSLYLEIAKKINNFQIYYNIGNCYYKLNDFGHAILYYEKSLKLKPQNKDAKNNLKLAKAHIQDKEITTPLNPFAVFFNFILSMMSVNFYTMGTFLFLTFAIGLGLLYLLVPSFKLHIVKKIFFICLVIGLFLGILTGVNIYKIENRHFAIVLTPQANVMSGPGETFSLLFPLHKGSKIRLLQTKGDWSLIILQNGFSGWIKNSDFENI